MPVIFIKPCLLRPTYSAFQIVVRLLDEADDVRRVFAQLTNDWFGNHLLEFLQCNQSFVVKLRDALKLELFPAEIGAAGRSLS